jgi:hypothetical protein
MRCQRPSSCHTRSRRYADSHVPYLPRHRAPGRATAPDREDARHDRAVVVAGTPKRRTPRREQGQDAVPLGVSERPKRHSRCDRRRSRAPGTGIGLEADLEADLRADLGERGRARAQPLGALGHVTAGRHGWVSQSPLRPAQAQGPSLHRFAHCQQAPADFGHGERDELGRGAQGG